MKNYNELRAGFETAYIDSSVASSLAYRPQFVSNNYKEGKKVLSSIEDELLKCDQFQISVAFITMSGITPLLQTLKELEKKNIPGEILTTNYLNFSEPRALAKLNELTNITLKMYDVEAADEGFHTKGYIFRKDEIYRIIIGSSNITSAALTSNREWNTKLISTDQGEMAKEIVAEFRELWNSKYSLSFDEFYENYKERYKIIKHQRDIAKQEEVTSLEKYKLQPNSMQVRFITNLKKIIDAGEERALLISATGTGKTYASAFAMRELGFKRVLFLVHRGQLARQTKRSYEKVFAKTVSMGLVGAGYHDYDADYVFATVQTLNRDEHLLQYAKDTFDCIVLDEAHHVPADTYQKIMKHFTPKLWLGMTATPDKRDDNVEGRNVYELFNYQIAYEIRLQQAMEENLLCPFHYFGITDLAIIGDDEEANRDFSMLTSDERVKHIITQADYYGYSGDKVKGLIFCSSIKETEELSAKFNQITNGATASRALLFPMESVYESYVAQQMKKVMSPEDWEVSSQDKGHYLFMEPRRQFALRPDIVMKRGERTVILDTKWKSLVDNERVNYGISQADMYQMYAYSKKYNTSEIWLLYPVNDEMRNHYPIQFESGDGTTVNLHFIDVDKIEESLQELRNKLEEGE